jgi:hypothetical protein
MVGTRRGRPDRVRQIVDVLMEVHFGIEDEPCHAVIFDGGRWQTDGIAVVVAGLVDTWNGTWTARIWGGPATTESAGLAAAAYRGNSLSERDAKHFFPWLADTLTWVL